MKRSLWAFCVLLLLGTVLCVSGCTPTGKGPKKEGPVETLELYCLPAYAGAYPSGYTADEYYNGGTCAEDTFILKNGARVDAGTPAYTLSYIQHGTDTLVQMQPDDRIWSDREYFLTFIYDAPEGVSFPESFSKENVQFNVDLVVDVTYPTLESAKVEDGRLFVTMSFDWPYEPLGLDMIYLFYDLPYFGAAVSSEPPTAVGYYAHEWGTDGLFGYGSSVGVEVTDYYWLDQGKPAKVFSHLQRQLIVSVRLTDHNYRFSTEEPWDTGVEGFGGVENISVTDGPAYISLSESFEILSMTDTEASICVTFPGEPHELFHETGYSALCTVDGSIDYYICTICGEFFADAEATQPLTEEQTQINAPGHHFVHSDEYSSAACCTSGGIEAEVCERCGRLRYVSTTPALGHHYVKDEKSSHAASCTQSGSEVQCCDRCGATFTTVIPATGHVKAYELRDWNTHRIYCSVCGADLGLGQHEHPGEYCTLCGYEQIN